ncbi:MAG: FAD:protein FMN transferase [Oscillospiraceae bacterium]|nr:FAD:protein FMN transferase [Oscillospiraceae bacterium]
MKIRKIGALVIILASAYLFGLRMNHLSGVSPKTYFSEGFYLDTYVTAASYKNETDIFNAVSFLDNEFQAAYSNKANALSSDILLDCISKTAALNEKYGDGINITCGELTALWGISTDNPRVPAQGEILSALESIVAPPYAEFGENTRLDFGAVAKGYACDYVLADLEKDEQAVCVVASMGSSALLYGEKPDGKPFKSAIKNPADPEIFLGYVYTQAAFISTTGGYERFFEYDGVKYEHIFDLNTGRPIETDLSSVTAVVPIGVENGGILSDFIATLVYMEGVENLGKYLDNDDFYDDFYIVAADINGQIYVSAGLDFEAFTDDG